MRRTVFLVWGRAVLRHERRAVRCSFGRAAAAGWRGSGRQRHQGDIEEALAVRRRRRWAAWRGGAWSSSCDPSATSSAILFGPGLVPQLQFMDRVDGVRDGVFLSVVHRDRYPQCLLFNRVLGVAVH